MNGDDLVSDLPAEPTEIIRPAPKQPRSDLIPRVQKAIKSIEDSLLKDSLAIMRDANMAAEIDPESDEVPEEWIAELGKREATRRFRIAKAAWRSTKEAPFFLNNARAVAAGIVKSRASEHGGPTLNVGVAVNMPMPTFKVVEVDE